MWHPSEFRNTKQTLTVKPEQSLEILGTKARIDKNVSETEYRDVEQNKSTSSDCCEEVTNL
jgi:hypothetical protein